MADEIEITDAMLRAGAEALVLSGYNTGDAGDVPSEEVASLIYQAMVAASMGNGEPALRPVGRVVHADGTSEEVFTVPSPGTLLRVMMTPGGGFGGYAASNGGAGGPGR